MSCYRDADVMTPYEKLKSLKDAERHLVPGAAFEARDIVAEAVSDLVWSLVGAHQICEGYAREARERDMGADF